MNHGALWALALLAAAIAWQTCRARQGKQARGRGACAVEMLHSSLDEAIQQLQVQAEAGSQLFQRPTREGFRMGVDPWPMPVAEEYAPWNEVLRTFYRVMFLLTANREEVEEHNAQVGNFALKAGGLEMGGHGEQPGGVSPRRDKSDS